MLQGEKKTKNKRKAQTPEDIPKVKSYIAETGSFHKCLMYKNLLTENFTIRLLDVILCYITICTL